MDKLSGRVARKVLIRKGCNNVKSLRFQPTVVYTMRVKYLFSFGRVLIDLES